MSTKLNAEELAAKRRLGLAWSDDMERAYAAAIREVSQPIADQRDELLAVVLECRAALSNARGEDWAHTKAIAEAEMSCNAAIAKCTPKP